MKLEAALSSTGIIHLLDWDAQPETPVNMVRSLCGQNVPFWDRIPVSALTEDDMWCPECSKAMEAMK